MDFVPKENIDPEVYGRKYREEGNKKKVETSENIWGHVAWVGEFENGGH